jgi:hypothetical protein
LAQTESPVAGRTSFPQISSIVPRAERISPPSANGASGAFRRPRRIASAAETKRTNRPDSGSAEPVATSFTKTPSPHRSISSSTDALPAFATRFDIRARGGRRKLAVRPCPFVSTDPERRSARRPVTTPPARSGTARAREPSSSTPYAPGRSARPGSSWTSRPDGATAAPLTRERTEPRLAAVGLERVPDRPRARRRRRPRARTTTSTGPA